MIVKSSYTNLQPLYDQPSTEGGVYGASVCCENIGMEPNVILLYGSAIVSRSKHDELVSLA